QVAGAILQAQPALLRHAELGLRARLVVLVLLPAVEGLAIEQRLRVQRPQLDVADNEAVAGQGDVASHRWHIGPAAGFLAGAPTEEAPGLLRVRTKATALAADAQPTPLPCVPRHQARDDVARIVLPALGIGAEQDAERLAIAGPELQRQLVVAENTRRHEQARFL